MKREDMTYLLWSRSYKDGTYELCAIYFTDYSGITYDGTSEFWKLPWAMKTWPRGGAGDVKTRFYEKLDEKLREGYTMHSAGCVREDVPSETRPNDAGTTVKESG
jgi:hypothetical protein